MCVRMHVRAPVSRIRARVVSVVYLCVCVYTYGYVCVCIYTYIYTYSNKYVYTLCRYDISE